MEGLTLFGTKCGEFMPKYFVENYRDLWGEQLRGSWKFHDISSNKQNSRPARCLTEPEKEAIKRMRPLKDQNSRPARHLTEPEKEPLRDHNSTILVATSKTEDQLDV